MKVSIENDVRYDVRQYTILDLPQNYTVSYLPNDFHYSDDAFGFSIQYSRQQSKVIAMQEWRNNSLMLQPKDFDKWNNAIKQILAEYKEQVVLQKK